MRASILAAVPFVAAALAQTTVVDVSSGSTTVSKTYTYSNFETQFLTETNSLGVVTGQPTAATSQPSLATSQTDAGVAITTQPEVATIPAGLPVGVTTLVIAAGNTSANSFIVSIGSSTTVVLGGAVNTDASIVTGATVGVGSASVITTTSAASSSGTTAGTVTSTLGSPSSSTSAASAAASSGAADSVHVASGALLGLGALVAAFL